MCKVCSFFRNTLMEWFWMATKSTGNNLYYFWYHWGLWQITYIEVTFACHWDTHFFPSGPLFIKVGVLLSNSFLKDKCILIWLQTCGVSSRILRFGHHTVVPFSRLKASVPCAHPHSLHITYASLCPYWIFYFDCKIIGSSVAISCTLHFAYIFP